MPTIEAEVIKEGLELSETQGGHSWSSGYYEAMTRTSQAGMGGAFESS